MDMWFWAWCYDNEKVGMSTQIVALVCANLDL